MKTLYLIGGPMGVGKTAVGQALKKRLPKSVFLDGDWCWDMHPFQVNAETKAMVLSNIRNLLGNFLGCSVLESIIFCWVMDEPEILQSVLSALPLDGVRVISLSLLCTEEALRTRLEKDIRAGLREEDIVDRSVRRLPKFKALDTIQVDTTHIPPEQVAMQIEALGR